MEWMRNRSRTPKKEDIDIDGGIEQRGYLDFRDYEWNEDLD